MDEFTENELPCSALEQELIILKEVYFKEIKMYKNSLSDSVVEVIIKPNTCDDIEKQLIGFVLKFICSSNYPAQSPLIEICQPRGMTEEEIVTLKGDMEEQAKEKSGDPMLYDLILYAKEVLTDQNIPHTACCICLEIFDSEEDIFKTPEYHYFHNQCISNYVKYETEKHSRLVEETLRCDPHTREVPILSILCPLCRNEKIKCSQDFVEKHGVPFEKVAVVIPYEWKVKADELRKKFENQLRISKEIEAAAKKSEKDETKDTGECVPLVDSMGEVRDITLGEPNHKSNVPIDNAEKSKYSDKQQHERYGRRQRNPRNNRGNRTSKEANEREWKPQGFHGGHRNFRSHAYSHFNPVRNRGHSSRDRQSEYDYDRSGEHYECNSPVLNDFQVSSYRGRHNYYHQAPSDWSDTRRGNQNFENSHYFQQRTFYPQPHETFHRYDSHPRYGQNREHSYDNYRRNYNADRRYRDNERQRQPHRFSNADNQSYSLDKDNSSRSYSAKKNNKFSRPQSAAERDSKSQTSEDNCNE